jgi:FKBP-type peptidyl-prolyl cis-trans isomerase FkpA
MLRAVLAISLLVSSTLFAACGGATTAPSNDVAFSQSDVTVGTGAAAAFGSSVTVSYTGWLYEPAAADHKGVIFDTSLGGSPFSFTVGAGQVIRGWDQGVPGMQVGGVRRLVIPSSLAYGGTRRGSIPPYATLVFDIELLSVQ